MNPYVTWAAGSVMATAGIASMFVFSRYPVWSKRLALVQVAASLVVISNEALRPVWDAYVGVWLVIAGTTIMNWWVCRRAERLHHRRIMEALEVLGELDRMHRAAAHRAAAHPPKEC